MKDWNYYRRLVTSEYRSAPKYQAMVQAVLKFGLEADEAAQAIVKQFDLEHAIGAQLDVLGEIVGVERLLNFQPKSVASPILTDEMYRFVIRCKIVKNHWDGTLKSLYVQWAELFPEVKLLQIQDLQDMSFNIVVVGEFDELKKELISHGYVVPKPEGVRINLITIVDSSGIPQFAYDYNTLYMSGYGSRWAKEAELNNG